LGEKIVEEDFKEYESVFKALAKSDEEINDSNFDLLIQKSFKRLGKTYEDLA